LPNISKTFECNRVAPPLEIENYIKENENPQTRRKTILHQRLLESYLVVENENRKIH
jgi:U3 small nucleolar RNA-associated protein 14